MAVTVKAPVIRIADAPTAAADESEGDIAAPTVFEITPSSVDGDSPQWPDDAAEVAFLSEQGTNGAAILPQVPAASGGSIAPNHIAEIANVPLPPLQTLVDRIPADARAVLEDLFRARFVSVKRVQPTALK